MGISMVVANDHLVVRIGWHCNSRHDEFPLKNRKTHVLCQALGLSNREMVHSLDISAEIIKERVQNILRKTMASDRR